jgi:hypothetical protein
MILYTIYISLFIQIITTLISFSGLFIKLHDNDNILKIILGQELIVQVIQFIMYLLILYHFNINTMAKTRYFDWLITTPIMLFSTMIYFTYNRYKEEALDTSKIKLYNFITDNINDIIIILSSNFFMLLFGYLGESGILNKFIAMSISYIFFLITFGLLYYKYAKNSNVSTNIFIIIFLIWNVYGIIYMMSNVNKNIILNITDLVSKNLFGLYLFYIIYTKSI